MYTLRTSRLEDGAALVELWRRSVDATHYFLSPEDRKAIDAEVVGFLPHTPVTVAVDEHDQLRGFMLINGTHMEALFIEPDVRGTGIGRQLLEHGLALHGHCAQTSTCRTPKRLLPLIAAGRTIAHLVIALNQNAKTVTSPTTVFRSAAAPR